MFQADTAARVADELPPAECEPSLDAHPGSDVRRQDLVLVGDILLSEPLDAGHGHDPGLDAVRLEQLARADGKLHFAAGSDEDDVRLAVAGVREDVAALGR